MNKEFARTIRTWADDFANAAFMFVVFSARIAIIPLWFTYVPLLSPVFGQGEIWWKSSRRTRGIAVHVTCGVLCLLCALCQLDKNLRHEKPRLHRWLGRLYLFTGLLTIASLQPLQSGVGRGPGREPSSAMQIFVQVTSIGWILSTLAAWYFAMRQQYKVHRRFALVSVLIMCVPITQRLAEWGLATPSVIALKLVADAIRGIAPWTSRWPHPAESLVISPSGYGVAEHIAFPFSAWLGLLLTSIFSLQAIRYDEFIAQDLTALDPLKKFILTSHGVITDVCEGQADLRGLVAKRRAKIFLDTRTRLSVIFSFLLATIRLIGLGIELVFVSIALVIGVCSIVGFFILAICHIVFLFELLPGLSLALPLFFMKAYTPAWLFAHWNTDTSFSAAVLALLHERAGASSGHLLVNT